MEQGQPQGSVGLMSTLSARQFSGLTYYEGHVDPGQIQPRQAGRVGSKVTKLTEHMQQHGYEGLPPAETAYTSDGIVLRDGHHRHDAATATGTPMHIIGSSSKGAPPGTTAISPEHYDAMWSKL